MRAALARIGGIDPLPMQVGEDVVVTTMDTSVTKKKVPLPERWLKGFAFMPILPARRDAHQFIELTAELATEQRREIVLPASLSDS